MPDCTQGWVAGALFGAQVLLLAVVPTADARLEADALAAHAHQAHRLVGEGGAPAPLPGVHASHPKHDHGLCDLCRALSVMGGPATAPERTVRAPRRSPGVGGDPERPSTASIPLLPLGPRAPPAA